MPDTLSLGPWVYWYKRNPQACLRLFCFPYAGAGASLFRTWAEALSSIEVCPVQLPGRENRITQTSFIHWLPLVETLARALGPYFDIPFAFFGHSMGALLSFELARQLRARGLVEPIHLFVSGHRAPQLPNTTPRLRHLSKPELVRELRRLRGTPEAVLQSAELLDLLLPTLRSDFAICERYVYHPELPLDLPISAFAGIEDRLASPDDLAGWREQTRRSFKLRSYPGDHFFLHTSACTALLKAIAEDLANYPRQPRARTHNPSEFLPVVLQVPSSSD